jgi:kumamolisin
VTCDIRKLCCPIALLTLFITLSTAACAAAENGFAALHSSTRPTTDVVTGKFSSSRMTVDVVLAPNNEAELSDLLADVYNPKSANYQHWLGQGEFYARFAPSKAQTAAVTDYLRESGLDVEESLSPFLVRVSGPSNIVETAFRTTLHNYRNPLEGSIIFQTIQRFSCQQHLASGVRGVVGLSNTVRFQSQTVRPTKQTTPACSKLRELHIVTKAQLFNAGR